MYLCPKGRSGTHVNKTWKIQSSSGTYCDAHAVLIRWTRTLHAANMVAGFCAIKYLILHWQGDIC